MVISHLGCCPHDRRHSASFDCLHALIVEVHGVTLLYISIALAAFIVAFALVVAVAAVGYLIVGLCWLTAEAIRALTNSNKEI